MPREPRLPRCRRCGQKAVYATWSDARDAIRALTRQRKAARGLVPYQCGHTDVWHIGRATTHARRRYQRKGRNA